MIPASAATKFICCEICYVSNSLSSKPNLNRFLSSSSVKFSILMAGLNCLGLRGRRKSANNKSAIFFLKCLYFSFNLRLFI